MIGRIAPSRLLYIDHSLRGAVATTEQAIAKSQPICWFFLSRLENAGRVKHLGMAEATGGHVCPICFEALDTGATSQERRPYVLDCGHGFHTACVMDWFRRSDKCPMCKNVPDPTVLTRWERVGTLKQISQLCRRKDCPAGIKARMSRLREHRTHVSAESKRFSAWRKEHKHILKQQKQWFATRRRNTVKLRLLQAELIADVKLRPVFLVRKPVRYINQTRRA